MKLQDRQQIQPLSTSGGRVPKTMAVDPVPVSASDASSNVHPQCISRDDAQERRQLCDPTQARQIVSWGW